MENPYASEWSRISGIASSVRQAQESVERLEEEARIMQEQAQSIPVERDENGNDINESLRESMRAQAQEAERQLQSARQDLKYAISSAHSLASRYRQQQREYEEKARKTAKAGGDFGKLAGYRFGASTASEAQRLTNQREKHYRDHVKVLSSLISAAERAAEGVEPTQETSEIADRGTYQKTGSKAGHVSSNSGKVGTKGLKGSGTKTNHGNGNRRESGNKSYHKLSIGEQYRLASSKGMAPDLLRSLDNDWHILGGNNTSDYMHNMITGGPLSEEVASCFFGCNYNEEVLQKDRVYYRVGNANGLGHWYTSERPESIIQARMNSAIPFMWIDNKDNSTEFSDIDTIYEVVVPAGTKVYIGPVRDQAGMSAGGPEHMQIYIPDISNIRIKEITPFTL